MLFLIDYVLPEVTLQSEDAPLDSLRQPSKLIKNAKNAVFKKTIIHGLIYNKFPQPYIVEIINHVVHK